MAKKVKVTREQFLAMTQGERALLWLNDRRTYRRLLNQCTKVVAA